MSSVTTDMGRPSAFALVLVKAAMANSFAYAFQIQLKKNKTLIQTIGFDLVLQNKLFK